ncbi:Echinoderm microtubule-associated protein-like [Nymphon striatum]|nr:Echinoderm microtubule-associated protein-like [Nymphon striatum]
MLKIMFLSLSIYGVILAWITLSKSTRAKMVTFFKNGDALFSGMKVSLTFATRGALNDYLTARANIPNGARYIFSLDGRRITRLEQLKHDALYVVSGSRNFENLPYGQQKLGDWQRNHIKEKTSGLRSADLSLIRPLPKTVQRLPNGKGTFGNTSGGSSSSMAGPGSRDGRIIQIVNNADHSVSSRVLLNMKTTQMFPEVLEDLGHVLRIREGTIKMYTMWGAEITIVLALAAVALAQYKDNAHQRVHSVHKTPTYGHQNQGYGHQRQGYGQVRPAYSAHAPSYKQESYGSYGYTDAYGLYRQVEYTADEYGFKANIKTNEPGTDNQNPADVLIYAEPAEVKYDAPKKGYNNAHKTVAHAPSYGQRSYAAPSYGHRDTYAAPTYGHRASYAPAHKTSHVSTHRRGYDDKKGGYGHDSHVVKANALGLYVHILKLSAAHVVLSQLEEIKSVVKAVYQKPETDMGDYWLSFLEMTDPLAQNVHACHTQQYYEDVSSSYEMFPGLMAYNNHEYGRHLPDFWAMLNNLSEDQSRYFSLHFAQSQTGLPYSCQPMDLWIEVTMNLGSKLKAGWLQLLQDDKQLFSTIRNANAVGRIRQALETQLNSKRKQSKHTDCQPARLRKDEKAVQDILTSLDAFECDLFGEDDPALRSIQSGIKTTESVALDLSVALPDGKAQADILLDQRVFSKDFKLSDRVPKNKRLTFDNNKVAKSGNKVISQAQMESAGLAAVIELAEGTGALTLEEIMENRVTEECLSIFNVDGSLRHTAKSKLFEHLNLQPTADKPAIYSSLIDMSMLFRLATPADREKKKQDGSDYKWQDYIDKICFMVHSRHPDAEQTYAINDPYPKPNEYSIKDDERDRRAASHPNAGNKFPTRDEKFPRPKEFSSFMSNSQNKVRLQNLVRQCLTNRVERNRTIWVNKGETTNLGTGEDHPDLIFNHTEADTMIFGIYAKLRAVYTQPIIIDSEDTDVYIQAAYVAKRTTGKMYIKRKKHLIDCTTLVDNEVADSIIAAHVISGSDHSSGFYHKGKASIIKCVITDAEARELLSGLGQEPELSEPVEAAAK